MLWNYPTITITWLFSCHYLWVSFTYHIISIIFYLLDIDHFNISSNILYSPLYKLNNIIHSRREGFLQKAASNLSSLSGKICDYRVCDVRDATACQVCISSSMLMRIN